MRDLDVGRFLRLRNAIREAMEAGADVGAAPSLARQYRAFRESAIELVPPEHEDELRALAPEIDDEKTRLELGPNPQSMFRAKELHGEVSVLLGGLAGFLDGYIQEAQMRMEAEEKARLAAAQGGQYL